MGVENKKQSLIPEPDENYQAFLAAQEAGEFDQYKPDTWVAYANGELLGISQTPDDIKQSPDWPPTISGNYLFIRINPSQ